MSRDERGTVTAFVVVFAFALLLAAGLVIDGGFVLSARREAIDEAEAAARAGTQAVSSTSLRDTSTPVALDPVAARARALAYIHTTGHTGTVTVNADRVGVDVSFTQPMSILGIAHIGPITVHGHGEAQGVRGISQGDD